MKRFVLDTHVVTNMPAVLAYGSADMQIIIPTGVCRQLIRSMQRSSVELTSIIREANEKGQILIKDDGLRSREYRGLDDIDASIVNVARDCLAEGGAEIFLVTQDSDLRKVAEEYGIKCLSFLEFHAVLTGRPAGDPVILKKAKGIVYDQRFHLIASGIAGAILTGLAQVALANIRSVIAAISTVGTFALLSLCGIGLFALRARFRLTYGVLEFLFGLMSVYLGLQHDFSGHGDSIIGVIKLVGGMYVMVRGMDNIGKGLKETTHWGWWSKAFPE